MSALKKTMEWIGFRDPAADELEEFDSVDEFEAPDFSTPSTTSDFASVSTFPTSHMVKETRKDNEKRSILAVTPRTYSDAQSIGDSFRKGMPVVMNLESMSEGEARRMVDFASGLIYGLSGSIERITNRVFLLTPESVSVEDSSNRGNERALFNQS